MQKSGTLLRSHGGTGSNHKSSRPLIQTANSIRTGGAVSSSHLSSSAKQKLLEKQRALPRILDDSGNDVTPKPLFESETVSRPRHASSIFQSMEGTSTPTDLLSTGSMLATNVMMTGGQSYSGMPDSTTHASGDSTQQNSDSMNDATASEKEKDTSALFLTSVQKAAPRDPFETIVMKETETFFLLDMPSTCLSNDDPALDQILKSKEKYVELCKSKAGNDSYIERGINTFNNLPKTKTTQTEKITINEKGIWATAWDMFDSENKPQEEEDTQLPNKSVSTDTKPIDSTSIAASLMSNSISKTRTGSIATGTVASEMSAVSHKPIELENAIKIDNDYKKSDSFKECAFFMERLLNQNNYQPKQAKYRGMAPPIGAEETKTVQKVSQQFLDGPSLEKLWAYSSNLTKDRNVSCITWNKRNQDLLAVGYGKFEFNDENNGLVCCWCLKNPEFPERFYKTDAGVTAVAFSGKHANLLAVGLFNGNILVFDVKKNNTAAILSTNETGNKHLSPVWSLKWTDRDKGSQNGEEEEMEVIMSISTDGRVSQWMIRKGFESSDYLKLKRITGKQVQQKKNDKEKSDGFISRYAGGLCFDIWDRDKTIYLCGTEEGLIHRCSISYNEQYLDSYIGHTGPIYKLAWSPFSENTFISASGDWTLRLWKADRSDPCLTFNSSTKSVYDVCWSHSSATLFCCVNENTIEIWDLSKSTLDPIYVANASAPTKLSTVSYAPNSNSILVGTSDGSVNVYALKNLPPPTKSEALEDIMKQILMSRLDAVDDDDEETKEAMEKHQLETSEKQLKEEEQEEIEAQEKKDHLDAFEAKLENIKKEHVNSKSKLSKKSLESKSATSIKSDKKDDKQSSSDEV